MNKNKWTAQQKSEKSSSMKFNSMLAWLDLLAIHPFKNHNQVMEYFTVQNILNVYGTCPYSQSILTECAQWFIQNRYETI